MLRRALPNALTLTNLLLGCFAAVQAISGNIRFVWLFTGASLIMDFLDGFLARRLKADSEMGRQLDSLADLISFGLVPALIAYRLWNNGYGGSDLGPFSGSEESPNVSSLLAFAITLASAWRLARFNLQKEDPGYFVGLSTPVNAAFWVCLPLTLDHFAGWNESATAQSLVLLTAVLLSSFLLISPFRFWSVKRLPGSLKDGLALWIMAAAAVTGFALYEVAAVPGLVLLYITLSLLLPPMGARC